MLLNGCSIRNKWLEIQAMISKTPMEIIENTITWVDTSGRDFEGVFIFSLEVDLVSELVVGECLAGTDHHHMVWCMVGVTVGLRS